MDINTALKLIDLGFTTEQIRNLETPAVEASKPVAPPVVETAPVVDPEPVVKPSQPEPIDYKKLAEEVALYNQKNIIVQPEPPKVETPPAEPPKSASDVLLNFLG